LLIGVVHRLVTFLPCLLAFGQQRVPQPTTPSHCRLRRRCYFWVRYKRYWKVFMCI
jgi:hypothetical protein